MPIGTTVEIYPNSTFEHVCFRCSDICIAGVEVFLEKNRAIRHARQQAVGLQERVATYEATLRMHKTSVVATASRHVESACNLLANCVPMLTEICNIAMTHDSASSKRATKVATLATCLQRYHAANRMLLEQALQLSDSVASVDGQTLTFSSTYQSLGSERDRSKLSLMKEAASVDTVVLPMTRDCEVQLDKLSTAFRNLSATLLGVLGILAAYDAATNNGKTASCDPSQPSTSSPAEPQVASTTSSFTEAAAITKQHLAKLAEASAATTLKPEQRIHAIILIMRDLAASLRLLQDLEDNTKTTFRGQLETLQQVASVIQELQTLQAPETRPLSCSEKSVGESRAKLHMAANNFG